MWCWLIAKLIGFGLLVGMLLVIAGLVLGQTLPGDQLAFVSDRDGNQEIYVLDVWHGLAHNLTRSPAHDTMPTWSGDGRWLAFRSGLDFYIMDSSGRNVRQLTRTRMGLTVQEIALSPDGSQLVYVRQESTTDRPSQQRLNTPTGTFFDDEIFIMDTTPLPDSGLTNAVNLTNNFTHDRFPVWRGDGTLVFATQRDFDWVFVTIDIHAPESPPIADFASQVTLPRSVATPVLSPDNTRIAYVYNRELFVYDIASRSDIRLTNRMGVDNQPAWSPDGQWLVFTMWLGTQSNLALITPDGSEMRMLTTAPGMNAMPVWRP